MGELVANDSDASFGDAPDGPTFGVSLDTAALQINGALDGGSDTHDSYFISIKDPANFYATTSTAIDPTANADFDPRLWLYKTGTQFDPVPEFTLANDDAPGGAPYASTIAEQSIFSALTGEPVNPTANPVALIPGTYLLIISGYPEDPLDSDSNPVASLSPFNELHGPNPVAGDFAMWSNTTTVSGDYTIAMRGVRPFVTESSFLVPLSSSADLTGDGTVSVTDLLALLSAWGSNAGHPADLDDDGNVTVQDLLILLGRWGTCGV